MDRAARFREVFEATYCAVRHYVHHRGVVGSPADDVVAETFVVAWRRLDDVPRDDPLPWMLAVARNQWLNQRRSNRRYAALLQRLPPPESVPPPTEPAPVGEIREALTALSPDDQEVLRLVAWDGLTPTEASQVLGCSPGTFRGRLFRARRRLADALGKRTNGAGQIPDESQRTREASDDRA